jgi:hypothetical protein
VNHSSAKIPRQVTGIFDQDPVTLVLYTFKQGLLIGKLGWSQALLCKYAKTPLLAKQSCTRSNTNPSSCPVLRSLGTILKPRNWMYTMVLPSKEMPT